MTRRPGILRRSTLYEMSQLLHCFFSQTSPLYDVQASSLVVLTGLPPARSPSLYPVRSDRCPRGLKRAPCSHLCGTAEEQGELSWPNMLIQRDTSPVGLGATFWISCRYGIQDFLGAGVVASLPGWQTGEPMGDSGHQTLISRV